MVSLLFQIRRWCFIYSEKTQGRDFALTQYKWNFGAILVPFYITLLAVAAVIVYKFGLMPSLSRRGFLPKLIGGFLLLLPYIVLVTYFNDKAEITEPISSVNNQLEENAGLKLLVVVLIGLSVMVFVPLILDKFIHSYKN